MKKKSELLLIEDFLNVVNGGHDSSTVAKNILSWIIDEKHEDEEY